MMTEAGYMASLAKALARKAHIQKASRNAPSEKIPNLGGTSVQYWPQQACLDRNKQIGYPKRVSHAAKRKANRRTKEKGPEVWSRDKNIQGKRVFSCPPPHLT
jgi:hypothetical protein